MKRQLALDVYLRVSRRDGLVEAACNGLDDRCPLGRGQGADALHFLAESFLPEPAIGVEHDFDRFGVVQGRQQERPHVALKLALGPLA